MSGYCCMLIYIFTAVHNHTPNRKDGCRGLILMIGLENWALKYFSNLSPSYLTTYYVMQFICVARNLLPHANWNQLLNKGRKQLLFSPQGPHHLRICLPSLTTPMQHTWGPPHCSRQRKLGGRHWSNLISQFCSRFRHSRENLSLQDGNLGYKKNDEMSGDDYLILKTAILLKKRGGKLGLHWWRTSWLTVSKDLKIFN